MLIRSLHDGNSGVPFPDLKPQPSDPLLSLARDAAADHRPGRIDLSVGVYRDETGRTPVMRAVKAAEGILLGTQQSKAYLGVEGDAGYLERLRQLLIGDAGRDRAVAALQTPGGTGALRLAADLLAAGKPGRSIWIGTPTWSNHIPVFSAAGLTPRCFEHFDALSQRMVPDSLLAAIAQAAPGDAILIQPVCQNPTGADIALEDMPAIIAAIAERRLIPLIDMAYHGFGAGLAADAARVQAFVTGLPDVLISYSCNKNFGLYRDRVGALFSLSENAAQRDLIFGNLQAIARTSYSMPPDHGAAVVRTILDNPTLAGEWEGELNAMTTRIRAVRTLLAAEGSVGGVDLTPIADQSGMFSMLPLDRAGIVRLRQEHAIYMADSGRINLAGLSAANVPLFVAALRAVQFQSAA